MKLIWLAALLQPAWSQESGSPEPVSPASSATATPWDEALNSAIKTYLEGDLNDALEGLAVLLDSGMPVPPEQVLKGLSYLAEVQYFLGSRQESWTTMLSIVEMDPEFRLDPFIHPPEIVSYFDSVRATANRVQTALPSDNSDSQIAFGTALIPGGWQLHNEQPLLAAATVTAVSGLSIATILLYNRVEQLDQEPARAGIQVYQEPDKIAADQLKTWTNITRVSAIGIWAGATLQGWVRSLSEANPKTSFWLGPGEAGLQIALHK